MQKNVLGFKNMKNANDTAPIIAVENVKKSFKKNDHQHHLVLDNLSFALNKGEIVALLGRSGSGKSTLLRIVAGLIKPTDGQVFYRGQLVTGPVKGLSMVFQNFALMPWLTVMQNVELGLEAQGVPRRERRERALRAIDIVGMDGFESAYPKELSGGMRQRVGFARALVVNPDVLLMDEPFSSLDVLTSENLRSDLLDLWQNSKTNTKCILFVTHNIEEAVFLADRIIVFGEKPGNYREDVRVQLPHPRDEQSREFKQLVDYIYTLMTTSKEKHLIIGAAHKTIGIDYRLPKVAISELTGLMETLDSAEYGDKVDLPKLANDLNMDVNNLFPLTEMLEILHFAKVSAGDIELTEAGKAIARADILSRKQIFAKHLMAYVPIAHHIRKILDERPGHRASEERFLSELEDHFAEDTAEEVLAVAIDWGRYAEIFAYDYNTGMLSLENPK